MSGFPFTSFIVPLNLTKCGSWAVGLVSELPPVLGLCCGRTSVEHANRRAIPPTAHLAVLFMNKRLILAKGNVSLLPPIVFKVLGHDTRRAEAMQGLDGSWCNQRMTDHFSANINHTKNARSALDILRNTHQLGQRLPMPWMRTVALTNPTRVPAGNSHPRRNS